MIYVKTGNDKQFPIIVKFEPTPSGRMFTLEAAKELRDKLTVAIAEVDAKRGEIKHES